MNRTAPAAEPKIKKERPRTGTRDGEKLVRRLERDIEKQEALLADLNGKLEQASADYLELTRLLEEKQRQEDLLNDLMEQWEQAQENLNEE